jgi:hypothetical protein
VRLGSAFTGRLAYYDRTTLTSVSLALLNAAVAPHGDTVRITYTTPTNRKAFVEAFIVFWRRVTAAAPVGTVVSESDVGLSVVGYIRNTLNAVDNTDRVALGNCGLLAAGDIAKAHDSDAGTGGTCDYFSSAKIAEFDA